MVVRIITQPEADPLTLDQVKEQLNIVDADKDNLLTLYLKASTSAVEKITNRAFVKRTIEVVLDDFPCTGAIEIPISPLLSIVSVKYDDVDGFEQTVSNTNYFVDNVNNPGWIVPNSDFAWPATIDAINAVRVRAIVGYEEGGSGPDLAFNVPPEAKTSILFLIGTWFENRESISPGQVQKIPHMLEDLVATLKVYR